MNPDDSRERHMRLNRENYAKAESIVAFEGKPGADGRVSVTQFMYLLELAEGQIQDPAGNKPYISFSKPRTQKFLKSLKPGMSRGALYTACRRWYRKQKKIWRREDLRWSKKEPHSWLLHCI